MEAQPAQRTAPHATVAIGVAAAALLSLLGSLSFYSSESAYQQQYRDPYLIGAQFERFDALRQSVPQDATLGYLTDTPLDSVLSVTMFDSAQYVMAPRILVRDPSQFLVLGNFTRPADFRAAGRQHGLRLERDFGNGVVLFRREGH